MNRTPSPFRTAAFLAVAATLIAATSTVCAASANNPNGSNTANDNSHGGPKAHAPDPNASASSNAVQAVLQKFDSARDQMVAHRQALVDQLAAAKTEAERKAVVDEMRNDQAALQDQARSAAREIRAELQALRRQRSGG